ncbi:MAG: hypothetical protein LC754_12805 [Acidobacteria bacterium]|nr:hypothetical protein [Acidobacteriota bacterium]
MNCQIFESTVNELARGRLMDAVVRVSALAHADVCARCAARLSDERKLSEGLRAVAAGALGVEAPARVETMLVAALHERAGAVAGVTGEAETCAQAVALKHWSWAKTFGTAAMAAAAAVLLLMLLPSGTRVQHAVPAGEAARARPETVETQSAGNASVQPAAVLPGLPASTDATSALGVAPRAATDKNDRLARSLSAVRNTNRTTVASANYREPSAGGAGAQGSNPVGGANEFAEITTDFIPLGHGSRLVEGDGGQVVRVELPRSALERFGLPMNVESAGSRIKADVLMGEDGIARAIRFVR